MRTFRSDINAGLCPEALRALVEANDGSHAPGYGDDPFTAAAVGAFREVFGEEASVWFVATGTAANTLALAALARPWERVLCHVHSHLNDDESTAPERFTGCRITAIDTEDSKLTVADVERHGRNSRGDVHQPQPGVLTLSNPTEFGTIYTPAEMRELCEAVHAYGYRVHVDGARFANAVAALGCDPRDLSVNAGVDALSFGGTKNGLAFGEAVLFFPQKGGQGAGKGAGAAFERAAHAFPYLRKGTGHLLSKHRFVSAPFAATLRDDIWLRHARHANAMAARLAGGLQEVGYELRYPTEANGVFVPLPATTDETLRAAGHEYYHFGDASWRLARLMCSFDTREEDVEAFLTDAARAASS